MKKYKYIALTLLLIAGLGLAGCHKKKNSGGGGGDSGGGEGGDGGGGEVVPPTPGGETNPDGTVTVYLDLGQIGLYEGKKGQEYADKFLENAIQITGNPGDALPGADKITSTSGATFSNWMYYDESGKTGAPTKYEVLPGFNCILLANWSGGSGEQGGGGGGGDTPIEGDVTYTVNDMPAWVTNDNCVIFAWAWKAGASGAWYTCTYTSTTSLTFTVDGEVAGFLLARCAAGTTTPDWSKTGDGAGRVYNQTEDVTCSAGVHTYSAASWKEYNPSQLIT